MILNVLKLGRYKYEKALDIQTDLLKKRQNNEIENTLILVEHPPVITIGKHGEESNIIVSEDYLKDKEIEFYHTSRGGDATYHGYGQVVGYPIFDIKSKNLGIKIFVDKLEEVFINLLKEEYNIEGYKHDTHRGVWVGDKKIVAIGLAVKRGVTMHGFAFNVNTKLEDFKLIVPCGIKDRGVTSVEKIIGQPVDLEHINKLIIKHFCNVFGYDSYSEIGLN